MQFDEIHFYYDTESNYRGTYDPDNGNHSDKPLVLRAKDCNAKYFYVCSSEMRGAYGNVPCLHVSRALGPVKKDPYNDDGRPPTCMLRIAVPHIDLVEHRIDVEGLEEPNLTWAGLLLPPYKESGVKPRRGVKYMTPEQKEEASLCPYRFLRRQRISLICARR